MNAQEIASQLKTQDLNLTVDMDSYVEPDEVGYFGSDYGDVEILSHIKDRFYVASYKGRMVIVSTVTIPDDSNAEILAMWELPELEPIAIDAYDNQYWTPFQYNFKLVDVRILDTLKTLPTQITDGGMEYYFKHTGDDWVGWIVPHFKTGFKIMTQSKERTGCRDNDVDIRADLLVHVGWDLLVPLPSNRKCLERKFAMLDALLQAAVNA